MGDSDASAIRHALETASRHGFRTVRLKQGDLKFRAEIGGVPSSGGMTIPEGSPELEVIEPISESYGVVEAEMVGYFKFSNGPLKPGTEIHEGDVIGSITALGIVSEVVSPIAGEVTEAMVGDGDPVEYGQPIVRVEVGI